VLCKNIKKCKNLSKSPENNAIYTTFSQNNNKHFHPCNLPANLLQNDHFAVVFAKKDVKTIA